jgi:hypothetical protein
VIYDGMIEHDALIASAIHAIVEQLRKHPAVEKILTPIITPDDFKSTFKCAPEKTMSSFSGIGVHHYKVCSEGSNNGLADIQVEVHAAMVTVPIDAGLCPERWKQTVDMMLEKVPGVSRSNKLRIIQFLEAYIKQVIRITLTRNIMGLAKEHEGIISEHQYGRSHKTCRTPVIIKKLKMQLIIQNKVEGIVFDNSVCMMGLLWSQLEHHIVTGYGVSDKTYTSTLEKLLYGIGQESCASPVFWALLNQLLLTALGDKSNCVRLVAVYGEEEHVRPGDSFVDDTTCGVTNDDTTMEAIPVEVKELMQSEDDLVEKMQTIIKFFLDLLQVLAPEKCVWFLICHR